MVLQYNHVVSSDFCAQNSVINALRFISVNISSKTHGNEIEVFYFGCFFSSITFIWKEKKIFNAYNDSIYEKVLESKVKNEKLRIGRNYSYKYLKKRFGDVKMLKWSNIWAKETVNILLEISNSYWQDLRSHFAYVCT